MTEALSQSEAPASITAKALRDYLDRGGKVNEARLHSVGRPCAFSAGPVLDDEGKGQRLGTPGEICVRGDLVMSGYCKDREGAAEVSRCGWHPTGDIGVVALTAL